MSQRYSTEDRASQEGGLGQRMRRVLEHRRRPSLLPPSRSLKKSLMMNPLRRAIFAQLSRRPGLPSGEIAQNLKTSRANINWHLDKLVQAHLLSKVRVGGRWAYLPANLLSEEEVPLFCVLGNAMTHKVYLTVRQRPGVSQDGLSKAVGLSRQDLSWHLGKLSRVGLITTVQDGRFRRYRASLHFDELAQGHSKRVGRFKGMLIAALKEDNVAPSIVKSLSSSLLLRIGCGEVSSVLEVVTDPYVALLKAKERAKKLTRSEK
jgi:DNA-binding transcriptional ArsR family regulator